MVRQTLAPILALHLLATACGGSRTDEPGAAPGAEASAVTPRVAEGEVLEHTLRFPAPHTNRVEVELVVPSTEGPHTELFMAVWTPGSYLVREFSRNVSKVSASTLAGEALAVSKPRKNRWRVLTNGAERFVMRYELYAHELSVRTSFVEDGLIVLNGASAFLNRVGGEALAHDVLLELGEGFAESVTSLAPHADGKPHHYLAPDFDTLVDSPIVAGRPTLHRFSVADRPHLIANFGEAGVWDGPRSARDVRAVVEQQQAFWHSVPYDRYVFLNVITDQGGGLEHRASTLLMSDRFATRSRETYLDWLGLVSHEFFHTWNVKRLRPDGLGPFDYENEVYTPSLWVAEGVTSYYDDLLVHRAGLSTRPEYLSRLAKTIEAVQATPGRHVQSLDRASEDAWIKFYRPDEDFVNSAVSYYRKGALVGLLLDVQVRRATGGRRSLDDVMRTAFARYSGDEGYSAEQFEAVASEVAGAPLSAFFDQAVRGTEDLDVDLALDYFGLELRDDAEEAEEEPAGWLGIRTDEAGGRARVTQVLTGTPAFEAGINVDDEIVAVDGFRVPRDLAELLASYRPEDQVEVLLARRGRLLTVRVKLAVAPPAKYELSTVPGASTEQRLRLNSWLVAPNP